MGPHWRGLGARGLLALWLALAPGAAEAADESRPPDYLGASLELAALMGLAELWYRGDTALSRADWKYDLSWETLSKKLVTGEALQFDDNVLYLNSPGHPAAGAMYYQLARLHRVGMAFSLLASIAGTAIWEFLIEFREVASINDLLLTPVGGLALGEPLFQVSQYFRKGEPTAFRLFLAGLFSFPSSISPLRSEQAPRSGPGPDGRVSLSAGVELARADGLNGGAGSAHFDAHLFGAGALSTRLSLGLSAGPRGLQDVRVLGETLYAGWGNRGALAALGALFEHEERHLPGLTDQLGAASPAGLALATRLGGSGLRISGAADLYPVLAAVYSQAWPAPAGSAPSVLQRHGYYWAYGARASARLELQVRSARVGLEVRHYRLSSAQRALARGSGADLALFDVRQLSRVWVSHSLPFPHTRLQLSFERTGRWSQVEEVTATVPDSRLHLQLQWDL